MEFKQIQDFKRGDKFKFVNRKTLYGINSIEIKKDKVTIEYFSLSPGIKQRKHMNLVTSPDFILTYKK